MSISDEKKQMFIKNIHDGNVNAVESMLKENNTLVNIEYKQSTPLVEAVKKQQYEIVKLLLINYRADANKPENKHHETPLFYAIANYNEKILDILLYYADVNKKVGHQAKGALHHAIYLEEKEAVSQLVKHEDIKLIMQDWEGNTPLHKAVEVNNVMMVKEIAYRLGNTGFYLKNKNGLIPVKVNNSKSVDAIRELEEIMAANEEEKLKRNSIEKKNAPQNQPAEECPSPNNFNPPEECPPQIAIENSFDFEGDPKDKKTQTATSHPYCSTPKSSPKQQTNNGEILSDNERPAIPDQSSGSRSKITHVNQPSPNVGHALSSVTSIHPKVEKSNQSDYPLDVVDAPGSINAETAMTKDVEIISLNKEDKEHVLVEENALNETKVTAVPVHQDDSLQQEECPLNYAFGDLSCNDSSLQEEENKELNATDPLVGRDRPICIECTNKGNRKSFPPTTKTDNSCLSSIICVKDLRFADINKLKQNLQGYMGYVYKWERLCCELTCFGCMAVDEETIELFKNPGLREIGKTLFKHLNTKIPKLTVEQFMDIAVECERLDIRDYLKPWQNTYLKDLDLKESYRLQHLCCSSKGLKYNWKNIAELCGLDSSSIECIDASIPFESHPVTEMFQYFKEMKPRLSLRCLAVKLRTLGLNDAANTLDGIIDANKKSKSCSDIPTILKDKSVVIGKL